MAQSLTDKVSNEEMNEVMDIKKLKLLNLTLLQILDRICKVKLEFDSIFLFIIISLSLCRFKITR